MDGRQAHLLSKSHFLGKCLQRAKPLDASDVSFNHGHSKTQMLSTKHDTSSIWGINNYKNVMSQALILDTLGTFTNKNTKDYT